MGRPATVRRREDPELAAFLSGIGVKPGVFAYCAPLNLGGVALSNSSRSAGAAIETSFSLTCSNTVFRL